VDIYEALYTTRAMRRVRPDPIPIDVQQHILDAAIRTPSGGNGQNWRFLLVDDKNVLARLAPIYQRSLQQVWDLVYKERLEIANADPDDPDNAQMLRVQRSAQWGADHFADYPLLMFSFALGDASGGSIHPATWSAMLAARAEGIGTSWTYAMVFELDNLLEVLGVPKDEGWVFSSCVTFGYPTGRWGVAPRIPAHEVSFRNQWGTPVGFEIPEPLYQLQG
jgi:nitroreductase